MHRKTLLFISGATFFLMGFFPLNQTISMAQIKSDDKEIYMSVGLIGKDSSLTGFFSTKRLENQDWCVFIGANGQVYKLLLMDKKVSSLYIDGQKIDDSQIEKHSAEYQSFFKKYLRSQEIEDDLEKLEAQMQPANRKIEAFEVEISKLDEAEEKLEKTGEKKSAEYKTERRNINAQQKKLSEMQREYEREIKVLSNQGEKLNDEQESLGLELEADKVLREIGEDLRSLGVIKSLTDLSFKLSNVELIVNGKKISPEVYEKLKARYIFDVRKESGFLYHWKWKS